MEKTLATLTIILSDDNQGASSNLSFPADGSPNYSLIIKPNVDKVILSAAREPLNMANLETILAHELGHFIADVLKDKTHSPAILRLARMMDDSRLLFPAENKAWKLGEIINPSLNKHIEDFALEGYKTNGANGANGAMTGNAQ